MNWVSKERPENLIEVFIPKHKNKSLTTYCSIQLELLLLTTRETKTEEEKKNVAKHKGREAEKRMLAVAMETKSLCRQPKHNKNVSQATNIQEKMF